MHIEKGTKSPLAHNSTPPTSGLHYGSLASRGTHTEPIPDELLVHDLEDGGAGVWYDCPDDCPELVGQLESVAARYHEGVLLVPYPGRDTRIALTAWNRVDGLTNLMRNVLCASSGHFEATTITDRDDFAIREKRLRSNIGTCLDRAYAPIGPSADPEMP